MKEENEKVLKEVLGILGVGETANNVKLSSKKLDAISKSMNALDKLEKLAALKIEKMKKVKELIFILKMQHVFGEGVKYRSFKTKEDRRLSFIVDNIVVNDNGDIIVVYKDSCLKIHEKPANEFLNMIIIE